MQHWLFKSEPDSFSWDQQVALGQAGAEWHGVRNYLARNNMRRMQLGDRGFFYHSNTGKEIVGIVEVCGLSHPDTTTPDPRWDCVDVRALAPLPRPVTLEMCKADPRLTQMALVKAARLSVQPVSVAEWNVVLDLAGLEENASFRAQTPDA